MRNQKIIKNQFSLKMLTLWVCLLPPLIALLVSRASTVLSITRILIPIVPFAVLIGIATWLSDDRKRTVVAFLIGIALGWLSSPEIRPSVIGIESQTFAEELWESFEFSYEYIFLSALSALVVEWLWRKAKMAKGNE